MTIANAQPGGPDAAPDPRRWIALFTLLLAGFMNMVDVTIVNVALPELQRDMGASSSQIEWVIAAYVIAFALGLLPLGRLGDIVGRRNMFIGGVCAFTVASVLCGVATSVEFLIIARFVQGLSGAVMMPQVLAIMQNLFPPEERNLAFSLFGLSAGLASASGSVLGGWLISMDLFDLSWRPIFLINIPIGLFAVLGALRLVPKLAGNKALVNDWIGILIASISVFLLLFPLIEGRNFGWPVWCFAMIAASFPGFALLVLWLRQRSRAGRSQLLPYALLKNRNYAIGVFASMAFFSCLPGIFMILALFTQLGFGFTPLEAGLFTLPFPLGILTTTLVWGFMGLRLAKTRLVGGVVVFAVSMVWMRQIVLGVTGDVQAWDFAAPLFISGIGVNAVFQSLVPAVLAGVPGRDAGGGAGGLQALQQVGNAFGIAVLGQIFFSRVEAVASPGAQTFVEAAANAMIYQIVVLILVIGLVSLLQTARVPEARTARDRA